MITTTCQDFVKTYPKDALFSNGKHDTLDSRNEKALGVRAILRCYDSDSSASHHSKTQPLTQGFAMENQEIHKKSTWTKYLPPYNERHVTIPSTLIVDKNLSDAGFRLLNYMFSNSDQWDLYMHKIGEALGWGKEKTTKAVLEIIELGYAKRELIREGGRFSHYNYCYYCQPIFYEENKKAKEAQKERIPKTAKPCTATSRTTTSGPTKQVLLKTILSNDIKKINQSTTLSKQEIDLIDDFSKKEEEKKHIHRECFLTDKEYQNCLRQKGTKEAIIEIIDSVLDWPDRKNAIKEWEKTILKWTKTKKIIDAREKNQKIGKELVRIYENVILGWSVREYRDTVKDDFGVLFEPQGCNSPKNYFISYSDAKFEIKIDDCCKLTVNRNK